MKKALSLFLVLIFALPMLASCEGVYTANGEKKEVLDLTELSGTVVFAQVSDMINSPDKYMGKTVRIKGNFAYDRSEEYNRYYFACVIPDATACCQNGIEFIWGDGSHDISEYPEAGTVITVEGIFDKYYEDGIEYIQLLDAKLEY